MRPTRDQLNMHIALLQAERGKCLRGKCGCVIAHDGRIITTGYNGSVVHGLHCLDLHCSLETNCEHSAHAEENAIAFAAKQGISLQGSTLYVTTAPCYECARLIIQSGIKEVIFYEPYWKDSAKQHPDTRGIDLMQQAGIVVRHYNPNQTIKQE
jgi:dCMP deaminase